MTTFSQLVDSMAVEASKPNLVQMLPGFLNQAIREAHTKEIPGTVGQMEPVYFADNMNEAILTVSGVTDDNPFLWQIPNSALFQGIGAIWYERYRRYARFRSPKIAKLENDNSLTDRFSWYRSGTSIAMSNTGGNGAKVFICWFTFLRSLQYYPKDQRPATWDEESQQFVKSPNFGGTLQQAIDLTSNWMIQRHDQMLLASIRSKHYARGDEQSRASMAYSSYRSMLAAMQATEQMDPSVHYGS